MAKARDKGKRDKEPALTGAPAMAEAAEVGAASRAEETNRRLAEIGEMIADLVHGQDLLAHAVSAFSTQLSEQRRVLDQLVARGPAGGDGPEAQPGRPAPLANVVSELHCPTSGRLDAKRAAEVFGLTLSEMARVLGRNLSTVSKTPDAPAIQDGLSAFERIAARLVADGCEVASIRMWAKTPSAAYAGRPPHDLICERMIEMVLSGLYGTGE